MSSPLKVYRFLNVLSIDVAAGAVCSSAWLADYFQVQLRIYAYLALGLTVWIIYTTDHLLDAKRIAHQAASRRHQFHQQNFRLLTGVVVLAIICDAALVFFIRPAVLYSGILFSVAIALYLVLNKWLGSIKEFSAAFLYFGGVLLPVVSIGGIGLIPQHILLVLSFFLTVLLNIIIFSWFDRENDIRDNQQSLVRRLGNAGTRKLIYFLFIIQLMLVTSAIGMKSASFLFFGMLIFMNGVLLIIFLKSRWFSIRDNYRIAGDAIFLFPLIQLLLL